MCPGLSEMMNSAFKASGDAVIQQLFVERAAQDCKVELALFFYLIYCEGWDSVSVAAGAGSATTI